MRTCPLRLAGIAFAVGLLNGAFGADVAPRPTDPNLPADYLDRILALVRQEHPQQVVSDFIYSDPQKVRLEVSGGAKKPVTALSVYFTPQTKRGPVSFETITRVVLFEQGVLLKDVGPGDPTLDWSIKDPPPPTDPNLPTDFRRQLLDLARKQNPTYDIPDLGVSDPVHVLVRDPAQPGPAVEMSAVAFSYAPMEKSTGSAYLMIIQGAALFSKGALVRTTGYDDKTVEWINGKPSVRPDPSEQRAHDGARHLTSAERLFNPVQGPAERRSIRHQIWYKYGPAFDAMELPPDTVTKLVELLEAVEEAQRKAQFAALKKGVDPFSAEMNKDIEVEKELANRNLEAVLGPTKTDRLEYIASARGYYRMVMANGSDVQLDLEDAGMPMTDEQIAAIGLICEDVCDPKRNPHYAVMIRQPPDPATGISVLWQEALNRAAKLLKPEQIEVMKLNLSDRSSISRNSRDPAVQSRWGRRWVMREYSAALSEMSLSLDVASEAKNLLLRRRDAPQALAAAARSRGEDPRSEEIRSAQKLAMNEVTEKLKALLGTAGYKRLEDLHEILPVRENVERSEAVGCEAMGCPLTKDQIRLLAETSWEARKSLPPRPSGILREDVDPATGLTARTTIILARSKAFLSSRQQDAIKIGYQDLAAAMNRISAEQPPPPKRYPPLPPTKAG